MRSALQSECSLLWLELLGSIFPSPQCLPTHRVRGQALQHTLDDRGRRRAEATVAADRAGPATKQDRLCSAHFAIGAVALAKDDKARAAASLRQSLDLCAKTDLYTAWAAVAASQRRRWARSRGRRPQRTVASRSDSPIPSRERVGGLR
jgi:hypothetical protein